MLATGLTAGTAAALSSKKLVVQTGVFHGTASAQLTNPVSVTQDPGWEFTADGTVTLKISRIPHRSNAWRYVMNVNMNGVFSNFVVAQDPEDPRTTCEIGPPNSVAGNLTFSNSATGFTIWEKPPGIHTLYLLSGGGSSTYNEYCSGPGGETTKPLQYDFRGDFEDYIASFNLAHIRSYQYRMVVGASNPVNSFAMGT